MRQSNVIFGALLFAFIVYITVRGQLPAYLDLFRGKGSGASGNSASAEKASSSGTSHNATNAVDTALSVFDKFSTMFS